MPYAIEYLGLRGICTTPEEFIRLAKCLQNSEPAPTAIAFADAIKEVNPKGKEILSVVAETSTPTPISLIRKRLALSSANQFSGIITDLKAKLRKAGFEDVLLKHVNGGEPHYSIRSEILEELKAALNQED